MLSSKLFIISLHHATSDVCPVLEALPLLVGRVEAIWQLFLHHLAATVPSRYQHEIELTRTAAADAAADSCHMLITARHERHVVRRYGMTPYVLQLNHLTPALKLLLPPTDSRLRPDLRLLEEGKLEEAEKENRRLDKLLRSRAVNTKEKAGKGGSAHVPRWFEKVEATPELPLQYRCVRQCQLSCCSCWLCCELFD